MICRGRREWKAGRAYSNVILRAKRVESRKILFQCHSEGEARRISSPPGEILRYAQDDRTQDDRKRENRGEILRFTQDDR